MNAQEDSMKLRYRTVLYSKTLINLKTGSGFLYELNDSTISLSANKRTKELTEYEINNIGVIHLWDDKKAKRKVRNGILIGAGTGLLIGLLASEFAESNKERVSFKIVFPLTGILYGGVFGRLFGRKKLKIPINGSLNSYNQAKKDLKDVLIGF